MASMSFNQVKKVLAVAVAMVLVLIGMVSLTPAKSAEAAPGGVVTITSSPDKRRLNYGGGKVVYTYTATNNTGVPQLFRRIADTKCSDIKPHAPSGMKSYDDHLSFKKKSYIPVGATATWTCITEVTQTQTNVVTLKTSPLTSVDGQFLWDPKNDISSSSTSKVTVGSHRPGGYTCDTLWYSSDYDQQFGYSGNVGTVDQDTGKATRVHVIRHLTTDKYGKRFQTNGSAAAAVDTFNPDKIFYIPRDTRNEDPAYWQTEGLWGVDILKLREGGYSEKLAEYQTGAVRLGAAPNGTLWVVTSTGRIEMFDPKHPDKGFVPKGVASTWNRTRTFGNGVVRGNLSSGDLAFDGNGTMWLIGSENGHAFLYTIPWNDLEKAHENDFIRATPVGEDGYMGANTFSGIAFTTDGRLWGSARDDHNRGLLYEIDTDSGSATRVKAEPSQFWYGDLGSCAMPKPELSFDKEIIAPLTPALVGDEITYRLTVTNLGSLNATHVLVHDELPKELEYVQNSTTLNGTFVSDKNGKFPYADQKAVKSPGKNGEVIKEGIVKPGESAIIEFKAKVLPTENKQVCNSANVVFAGADNKIASDDPDTLKQSDLTCIHVFGPEIGVKKTADAKTLMMSPQTVKYSYEVTNPGNEDLREVSLSDDKCPHIQPVVSPDDPNVNIGDTNKDKILQAADVMQDGHTVISAETWRYTCTSELIKPTTNIATARGEGINSHRVVTSRAHWTVDSRKLEITKTSDASSAGKSLREGETVAYTITVKNGGNTDQTNVVLQDQLPVGVRYVDGSAIKRYKVGIGGGRRIFQTDEAKPPAAHGAAGEQGMMVSDNDHVTLKPGESLVVTFNATVNVGAPKTLTNVAQTWSRQHDRIQAEVTDKTETKAVFTVHKFGKDCDTDKPICELDGSSFAIFDKDPSQGASPIADVLMPIQGKIGSFTSTKMKFGKYWLVETAAPNGYILMAEPVRFKLDADGVTILSTTTSNVSVRNGDKFAIDVVDQTHSDLPRAGGIGLGYNAVAGFILVFIGLFAYYRTSGCEPRRVRIRN
ncbi:DUF7507 domain-containing protein [Arcanobacterium canis]